MWTPIISIDRNGANTPEEMYRQFDLQTDMLGEGRDRIDPDEFSKMVKDGWITLQGDKIVWGIMASK